MKLLLTPSRLEGTVTLPPSKSLLHRELICRRLAGQTTPLPPDAAQDVLATRRGLDCLTAAESPVAVDCGDSGSTLRFLLPLFMALGRTDAVFTGSARLLERPVPREWDLERTAAGIAPTCPLTAGRWVLSGAQTSQALSGMLMALPLLKQDSELLTEGEVVSRPYLRMTAAVMTHHGVTVERVAGIWHICGGQQYRAAPLLEEPDWSAAAFWLVLHRILLRQGRGEVYLPLPPPPYLQGDAAVLDYLDDLPAEVDISDTPDLLPPLALYAALLPERVTRFTHGAFLRRKESDRLSTVTAALNALGAWVRECEDGITVSGVTALHGGEVSACGDHRIAMLVGCAAMTADAPVLLDGAECAAKSYPTFWRELAALGGKWEVTEP